jgi:hypothetical protein
MASSGKKKTTMAKLARESKLRERRLDKQARKDARRLGLPDPRGELVDPSGALVDGSGNPIGLTGDHPSGSPARVGPSGDRAGGSPAPAPGSGVEADGEGLELVEEERLDVTRTA